MTRRAARTLTRLYARDWRERYGREFEALLFDVHPTAIAMADIIYSAGRSRAREILLAAAIGVGLLGLSGAAHVGSGAFHERLAVARTPISVPCRSYSSVSAGGWTTRQQCTD